MARPSRRQVLEDTLVAVEEGRLSVERLVRAALEGREDYASWLRGQLERVEGAHPRRVQVRRKRRVPEAVLDAAEAQAERLAESLDGVLGAAWGTKHRAQRVETIWTLVFFVESKRPEDELDEAQTIPPEIAVEHRGRTWRFQTDVQVQKVARRQARRVSPGLRSGVRVGSSRGALSFAHEGEAVISGHVAGDEGAAVTVLIGGHELELGTVRRKIDGTHVDGAAVTVSEPQHLDAAVGSRCGVRTLGRDHEGYRVVVRRPDDTETTYAYVDGVAGEVRFRGGSKMTDLLRLHRRLTERGDSGSPVFDAYGALVGVVVGADPDHTYVLDARRILDALF